MTLLSDTTKPDLRINNILSDIEKIKLEKITKRDFVNTDVYLDGRHFESCLFKDCRIFVKLGHFRITGRIHIENCEFVPSPPANGIKSISDMIAQQPLLSRQPKKKNNQ